MASTYHKTITALGLIFLFHAAYSAAQHRSFLRLTEQEFTSLPIDVLSASQKNLPNVSLPPSGRQMNYNLAGTFDIIIQGIVSLFLTMYGVMYIAGDFKEIRATEELQSKTWETQRNLPSFYCFNHRGSLLRQYS